MITQCSDFIDDWLPQDFHRNTSCWIHVQGMKPLLSSLFRSKNSKFFPFKSGLVSSLQNIKEPHSQTNLYFSDAVCRQDKADSHSEAECPCQKEAGEHRCNGELGLPSWQPLLFECTVIWTPGRLGFSFSGKRTRHVFHFLLGERKEKYPCPGDCFSWDTVFIVERLYCLFKLALWWGITY